jgi:hypothetical protein
MLLGIEKKQERLSTQLEKTDARETACRAVMSRVSKAIASTSEQIESYFEVDDAQREMEMTDSVMEMQRKLGAEQPEQILLRPRLRRRRDWNWRLLQQSAL